MGGRGSARGSSGCTSLVILAWDFVPYPFQQLRVKGCRAVIEITGITVIIHDGPIFSMQAPLS